MTQKNVHVVVGGRKWEVDSLKYRRHRLAEFLLSRDDTDSVIWVSRVNASPRKPSHYMGALNQLRHGFAELDNGVSAYSLPFVVPARFRRMNAVLQGFSLRQLRERVAGCRGKKVLWFTLPVLPFLTETTHWDRIIYDCSDLWAVPMDGKDSRQADLTGKEFTRTEKFIIDSSDLVFATSEFLAEHIEKDFSRKAVVVENGVDFELFTGDAAGHRDVLKGIPGPRLGFVGGMKRKIDFPLLMRVADDSSNWSIVLIGPGPSTENKEFAELVTRGNVHWVGGVEPSDVPQYMRNLDVGLLPYKEIEYNRAVFPLKLFEYLAVGLPVVGCGLPSTAKYDEHGVFKQVPSEEFLDACRSVLMWEKDERIINRRIQLAENASWQKKFEYMYDRACERVG